MDTVNQLEGKDDLERKKWIFNYLSSNNFPLQNHDYGTGGNLYVPSGKPLEIGVSSHFDVVPGSPGANDNASAVAVTLELLRRFREYPLQNLGMRAFFFDEEEKYLIGSKAYIRDIGVKGLIGVYNMEMVGQGDKLAIWPVSDKNHGPLLETLEKSAESQGVDNHRFDKIVVNTSDHQSFSNAGIESFCLTNISKKDLRAAESYYNAMDSQSNWDLAKLWMIAQRAPLFKHYHKPSDKSKYLSEDSLQMTANLLEQSIRELDLAHS